MKQTSDQRLIRLAIDELYEIESGSGLATPEQLLSVSIKYGIEVWKLEGLYLDEVEANANA